MTEFLIIIRTSPAGNFEYMTNCYHCSTPIQPNRGSTRQIDGSSESFCCEGCATVAAVIHQSGLETYYKKRTALPRPVDESRQSIPLEFPEIFDDQIIQDQFVESEEGESCNAQFIVQEMHCPTCVWLIENRLGRLAGIREAKINFRTRKLTVKWQPGELALSEIVKCVQELGYRVVPFSQTAYSETVRVQHQDLLKRLGIAGVFGMQIMVIAVALYSSEWTSIESTYEELFRRLSLLFVLPILFYSAAPIFSGALRDLKRRTATMDVPIALGLLIAFVASFFATISGEGEVYYDSIAMFVCFQLIARFLEHGAYRRMTDRITNLSASSPGYANRLNDAAKLDSVEVVPAIRLDVGDRVVVNPGEVIPTDGTIESGTTDIDEAILTGESNVLPRSIDDSVIGGSVNVTNSIVVRVTRRSSESALASIVELLENSIARKPTNHRLTDLIAAKFSATVVLLAACVSVFWILNGSGEWLSHTIAVLVVACPCALSLAVPTALTAAVNAAAKRGILLAHPDRVQALAKANTFLFDKTGTLTESQARLNHVETPGELNRSEAMNIAASLAQFSDHPICKALANEVHDRFSNTRDVESKHGGGIQGTVDGKKYYLGSFDFIESQAPGVLLNRMPERGGLIAYLCDDTCWIASFQFDNALRKNAISLVDQLSEPDTRLGLLTGDRQSEAERIAAELGITEIHAGCSPSDKLDIIQMHQARGECVAMIGDGVNDAPTLAAANVSVAPANAQHIAKAHADVLLLDDQLSLLAVVRNIARFALKVMRTNTIWAIAYNLIGISLAAAGFVPPLAAAIGMSVSSLLVVGNSLRIMSYQPEPK